MRKLRAFLKGNCDMNDEREAVVFEELLRGALHRPVQRIPQYDTNALQPRVYAG